MFSEISCIIFEQKTETENILNGNISFICSIYYLKNKNISPNVTIGVQYHNNDLIFSFKFEHFALFQKKEKEL